MMAKKMYGWYLRATATTSKTGLPTVSGGVLLVSTPAGALTNFSLPSTPFGVLRRSTPEGVLSGFTIRKRRTGDGRSCRRNSGLVAMT